MANSYNKIILVGRLGRDAELRATPQGRQVASLNLAVEDRNKKDDRGRPGTEWFRVSVWGREAETLHRYLLKGKVVLVEGRLSIRTYQDRDGKDRYSAEVSADRTVLLGGNEGGSGGGSYGSRGDSGGPEDFADGGHDDPAVDDIPF